MHQIEQYFDVFVRGCILLIEMAGISVIVISMVRGFVGYIRKHESIRIDLAQGIMLGLEFKVGSEVLRSVIVSGWNELGTLAAVILLRSMLTLLLHWEIRNEEERLDPNKAHHREPITVKQLVLGGHGVDKPGKDMDKTAEKAVKE